MSVKIKYQWRITKYNPIHRNEHGYYTIGSEWTSSSDIGKNMYDGLLTLENYIKVETAYIDKIIRFLEANNIKSIWIPTVTYIDTNKESTLYDKEFDKLYLQDDQEVSIAHVRLIAKMVLREFIHCNFITRNFFVHFGYDYYLYIGSNSYYDEPLRFTEAQNLFVEEVISPYYTEEKDMVRSMIWTNIEDDVVIGQEILRNISLKEYQKILRLSTLHPVTGSFSITKDNFEFFQSKMHHQMDFTKYNYYLDSEYSPNCKTALN